MAQTIIVTCVLLWLVSGESGMAISRNKQAELRVVPAIQNTTACYASYFSQKLCFDDTTIEITTATYGQSMCNAGVTQCCEGPDDCTILVQEASPDYYNDILVKCNNKHTCEDLDAQRIDHVYRWCTGAKGATDYITLHYMCLTDAERLTTTTAAASPDVTIPTTPTTLSTIKPGSATPVTEVSTATSAVVSSATATVVSMAAGATTDSEVDNSDASQTTVIIAVVVTVVVVVVAVVVAVTVWMVYRKRKANSTSEENKTVTDQSARGMMTSHASARVDDVDPYHTARPGGQPPAKPVVTKEPKPNSKAIEKPNIGADLYTEVVKVRPRKNVVLDKSPGEEDVEANNNGSDMTEAGDRASYDLVMQENHGYGTRQRVSEEGEGEGHGDWEGLPHEGRQDGNQDEQTDPDYDLVMTENNAYS